MATALVKSPTLCDIDKTPPNDEVAIATLKDLFGRRQEALSKIAAKHLTPERLARIAINCVSKTPLLLECTPISVVQSVMAGASMGLEAGGPLGEGYLIPRWNSKKNVRECQFLPGYKGLIALARRSGFVLSIEADVVYEADEWSYSKTEMGTSFTHIPSDVEKPGEVLRSYAIARLKDTPLPVVVVMPRREIEAIRLREKKRGESPWDTDYAEMAKKTSIRRICKYLPMSIELASCLDAEAEDDDRDVIDITPAPRALKQAKPGAITATSEISGPPQPTIDRSESQEEIEPLADVLNGISALKTGDECSIHAERLKVARWRSEDDRKAAVAALKLRWKTILDAGKAAMKAATSKPTVPARSTACSACDVEDGHAPGCPNSLPVGPPPSDNMPEWAKADERANAARVPDTLPGDSVKIKMPDGSVLDGDQIQGREREPGEEG